MFEHSKMSEKIPIDNMFINNLYQFQWQIQSTDTFDHLFFGESLKLESVWDHTLNTKCNVSYSTFTNVFYSCHVFDVFFNVFYFNLTFFTSTLMYILRISAAIIILL